MTGEGRIMFTLTYLMVGGPLDGRDIEVELRDLGCIVFPYGYAYIFDEKDRVFRFVEDMRRN